jgi:hypothetical protein
MSLRSPRARQRPHSRRSAPGPSSAATPPGEATRRAAHRGVRPNARLASNRGSHPTRANTARPEARTMRAWLPNESPTGGHPRRHGSRRMARIGARRRRARRAVRSGDRVVSGTRDGWGANCALRAARRPSRGLRVPERDAGRWIWFAFAQLRAQHICADCHQPAQRRAAPMIRR